MRSIFLCKGDFVIAFGRGIIAPSAGGFSPPLRGIGNQREGVLDEIVYPIKMLTDNGDCASFPRASLACRAKLIKQPRARGLARKTRISIVVDNKHTKHAENVKGRLANPRELWEHNLRSTLESCGSPILRTARVRNNGSAARVVYPEGAKTEEGKKGEIDENESEGERGAGVRSGPLQNRARGIHSKRTRKVADRFTF